MNREIVTVNCEINTMKCVFETVVRETAHLKLFDGYDFMFAHPFSMFAHQLLMFEKQGRVNEKHIFVSEQQFIVVCPSLFSE